jgi:hypothetical protein
MRLINKFKKLYWTGLALITVSLVNVTEVVAATCTQDTTKILGPMQRVACQAGIIPSESIPGDSAIERFAYQIGSIFGALLGFVGVVFILMGVWAGYNWMTARGNSEKVRESQDMLRNAVIGVVVVFSVFAITRTVLSNISSVVAPAGF